MKRIDLSDWAMPSIDDAPEMWRKHLRAAVTEVLTIIVNDIELGTDRSHPWFSLELLRPIDDDDQLPEQPLRLVILGDVYMDLSEPPTVLWQGDFAEVIRDAVRNTDLRGEPEHFISIERLAAELRGLADYCNARVENAREYLKDHP